MVLYALSKAKEWGYFRIHLFSDALEVISGINDSKDWVLDSRVLNIRLLMSHFERSKCSYVPRILNGAAHLVANYAESCKCSYGCPKEFEWCSSFSS